MNYEVGLARLRECIARDALPEFSTLEYRLLENLRAERRFGTNETIRSERAAVISSLNEFSYAHTTLTFVELCRDRVAVRTYASDGEPNLRAESHGQVRVDSRDIVDSDKHPSSVFVS